VPSTGGGAGGQARYAFAPRALAVLTLNFLVFAALFSALTYIVAYLESVAGVCGALVSACLLGYGVATAVGSFYRYYGCRLPVWAALFAPTPHGTPLFWADVTEARRNGDADLLQRASTEELCHDSQRRL
jgi:hypothetical protein